MPTEYPTYTPDSIRTPNQVITTPRTDEPPLCINHIVSISHAVEITRRQVAHTHPSEIDEAEAHTLWHEHHLTSMTLLRRFMTDQIHAALDFTTDPKIRRKLEEYHADLSTRHIFDSIYLLAIEPQLFLSNLTAEEVSALYKLCQQLGLYERNEATLSGLRLYATALLTVQN